MKKEEFYFDSRDNKTRIHAVRYTPDDGNIKAIVQIIHGMAEYVERYEELAQFLTERGFVVTGEDHLGHGKTVGKENYGYFCEQDPATVVVRDVHRLKKMTQQLYPAVPYVILGHSMGSFILRNYLCRYGSGINGAVICGTGMQSKALLLSAKAVTEISRVFLGDRHVGSFIDKMSFGKYNKKFAPARTSMDWLSKDTQKVDQYMADPMCGFTFTINGFRTLFELISRLYQKENLQKIPSQLPVLFLSGSDDPVGEYEKGVNRAYASMEAVGMERLQRRFYAADRHELFNETDRATIMEDVYQWIGENVL